MVQSVNQLKAMQALNNSNQTFGTGYNTATQPYPEDSYGGKTLLKAVGIIGAIAFRKNIAGLFMKYFPSASKLVAENFGKVANIVQGFCAKNPLAGKIAGYVGKGTNMLVGFCDKLVGYLKP